MRHNVVDKVLPRIIGEHWRHIGFQQRRDIVAIRQICREVDLLHPQVDDDGRRPENVEYPWLGNSGEVEVPALWNFSLARSLYSNPGRQLLKAATMLTRNASKFIR